VNKMTHETEVLLREVLAEMLKFLRSANEDQARATNKRALAPIKKLERESDHEVE
jgi:hypothetical protein